MSIRNSFFLSTAAAIALSSIVPALAADPAPAADKGQYNLFNRTPDDKLRDFSADRPAKSYGPTTIDGGRVQLETELFNYTHQKTDGVKTQTYIGPNPTVRVGLTSALELQLNYTPFVHQRVTNSNNVPETSTSASGSSDFFARAKMNLIGNEGGKFALALMPYVKAGTAPESLGGNRATEYGLIIPYAFTLREGVTLTLNTEWDSLKNANNSSHHSQFVQTAGVSFPIVKDWTGTLEFWTSHNYEPTKTVRQYSFDTALAYAINKNLQWDIGANFGLNKDTPGLQVYTGLAARF